MAIKQQDGQEAVQAGQGSAAEERVSDAELISAWMDGELGVDEAAALLRRVEANPALRATWLRMHVAQDAIRSQDVALMALLDCEQRVDAAVESEASHAVRKPLMGAGFSVRHFGLQGLALAAGIAAVVWIAVPLLRSPADASGAVAAVAVVPSSHLTGASATRDDGHGETLNYYLQAHSDLADGGLMSAAPLIRASYAEER